MRTKRLWIIGSIVVVLALLLGIFGCAQATTTTTTQTTTTQTTTTRTTTTQTTTTQTTTAAAKTLKIGGIFNFANPVGLDMYHAMQVATDMDNAKGGLLIGGERYKVELIAYDDKNDQAVTVAAANRLIFVDGVKFVCHSAEYVDAVVPIMEANKIIYLPYIINPDLMKPDKHYTFQNGVWAAATAQCYGWFDKKYPDKKTVVLAAMDNQMGHFIAGAFVPTLNAFRFKVIGQYYYPDNATDLSALGLRVANDNPDIYNTSGGGPALDALAIKGIWQAGYKGQLLCNMWTPALALTAMAPVQAVEGMIAGAWPVEFDPPTTAVATEFKAAWIAKFGKWEGPEIQCEVAYEILKAALVQTGSFDADKVAAVISNGLKFEGPGGPGQMVPRLDLGNSRTVDEVVGYPFKIIKAGKPVLLDTFSLDDARQWFNTVYKAP